ncbi:MAG TPA: ATP-dependent 6-phosphofructokinase [Acidimicrobiia bacterium]|nr:ATP-dependent 6-phosphofructokinase [Acidimicrobiia bacterium]
MSVIGILTAGGDCPGLNAVIRAVVTTVAAAGGHEVVGVMNGWQGLMEGDTRTLGRDDVRGILGAGGTILGTSRMDPYVHGDGFNSIRPTLERNDIDSLIVVGGDGTLRTALRLADDGVKVIGVPKTIDNDIAATDVTFGFDTAVQVATDALDRLTTTAEAHNRVMLCEVMGRTKGWIALYAGLAAGADAILIPEHQLGLDEVARIIKGRHRRGRRYSIVVVAEGVEPPSKVHLPSDAFGFERLGGVAYRIAPEIEALTGFETRVTVLGHLQRGGTPTAFDRVLATRMGAAAADLALAGEHRVMVALQGTRLVPVPLEDGCAEIRGVDPEMFAVAQRFFG